MHALGDFSETAHNSLPPPLPRTPATATPTSVAGAPSRSTGAPSDATAATPPATPRLKRLNNAQQHNVYTLMQTPEGAVKFRCTECSRCFNLKCTLLRHVRHQHQGRFVPHPCGQCGQVFKRTDHLKVHMRKIHKMTSASRSNRGNQNNSADAGAATGTPPMGDIGTNQSALVAAAVASMANTQPLMLTKEDPAENAGK